MIVFEKRRSNFETAFKPVPNNAVNLTRSRWRLRVLAWCLEARRSSRASYLGRSTASYVMPERTLKESISDWTDWDRAAYSLGICLGMMPDAVAFGAAKHVFWSNHPIGDLLFSMLDRLVEQGVLEKRDEPDIQYRWSSAFRGSWEDATSTHTTRQAGAGPTGSPG